MKKVKVIKSFNDKLNDFITRHVNETFECPEERAKELEADGFVWWGNIKTGDVFYIKL